MYKKPKGKICIQGIGILALIIGLIALYYAPLEIYCFYLFSKNGIFAYEEFQMGSFWFAVLFINSITYYIIAIILLPLGLGTVRLYKWAHKLTLNFAYVWMTIGISLLGSIIFSQSVLMGPDAIGIMVIGVVTLFAVIIPLTIIKFYKSNKVIEIFEEGRNNRLSFIDRYPLSILIIGSLNVFYLLLFHILIFFKCILPVFGEILFGRESIRLISLVIFILVILTYGLFNKKRWSFWGLLTYYSIFLISWGMTFYNDSTLGIIKSLNYSNFEYENIIARLTDFISYFNVTVFICFLTIILLALIWRTKEYFYAVKKN